MFETLTADASMLDNSELTQSETSVHNTVEGGVEEAAPEHVGAGAAKADTPSVNDENQTFEMSDLELMPAQPKRMRFGFN